jgi:hypothetical protein
MPCFTLTLSLFSCDETSTFTIAFFFFFDVILLFLLFHRELLGNRLLTFLHRTPGLQAEQLYIQIIALGVRVMLPGVRQHHSFDETGCKETEFPGSR